MLLPDASWELLQPTWWRDACLFSIAAGVSIAAVVEAIGSLDYSSLDPKRAAAAKPLGAAATLHRKLLAALRYYSDWWYRAMDAGFGCAILLSLAVCTFLPLAQLQAVLLFRSNFAALISARNRRQRFAELLQ